MGRRKSYQGAFYKLLRSASATATVRLKICEGALWKPLRNDLKTAKGRCQSCWDLKRYYGAL
eukprot:263184-Pyramimonas_sp.AAC.1